MGGQGRPSKEGTFRRQLRGEKALAMGILGDKSGPGRGNGQCQDPEAGAVGRVHRPWRRQGGQS